MPTEYPLGKARKATLAAKRREYQIRAQRRILLDMPRILMALHASRNARGGWHDHRTGNVGFRWFSRTINYAISTQTLLVRQGNDNSVYTHYTPQQLIDDLSCDDPLTATNLFKTGT
jgi:hypothetical protein